MAQEEQKRLEAEAEVARIEAEKKRIEDERLAAEQEAQRIADEKARLEAERPKVQQLNADRSQILGYELDKISHRVTGLEKNTRQSSKGAFRR